MSLDTEITANFYDEETGELIEIKDGYVVARHNSILSKHERSQLVVNRPRTHSQEPLPLPVMFPGQEKLVTSNGNDVSMPEMFPADKPVTNDDNVLPMPVMTWD